MSRPTRGRLIASSGAVRAGPAGTPAHKPEGAKVADNSSNILMRDGTMITDETGEVLDLLHYKTMQVQVQVKVAANSGQTLQLQHSAVNEADAFIDLGTTFDIASVGNQIKSYDEFLRYVRLKASGSITTQPTLSIAVMAKED